MSRCRLGSGGRLAGSESLASDSYRPEAVLRPDDLTVRKRLSGVSVRAGIAQPSGDHTALQLAEAQYIGPPMVIRFATQGRLEND